MRRIPAFLGAALCAGLLSGCVEQRFVVESDPPGAVVYLNGAPLGTTPCDGFFVYHGGYDITLVKPGYETLHVRQQITTPWYEFFPLDFISESIIPWTIHDVRRFRYVLAPVRTPSADEILPKSENLRNRGKALQVPPEPNAPAEPILTTPATPPPAIPLTPTTASP